MSKRKREIEKTLAFWPTALTAAVALSISLADVLGLEKVKWFHERIPVMSLLVAGVILGTLTLVLQQLFIFNEYRLSLRKLRRDLIKENTLAHLRELTNVDQNLMAIAGSEIHALIEPLRRLIREKELVLYQKSMFKRVYQQALEHFRGSKFIATSLPYKAYFWNDGMIEEAHRKFIDDTEGQISRIFMLDDEDEVKKPEVSHILETQRKLKVEVYYAIRSKLDKELQNKYILADEQKRVGWEVEVGSGHEISKITITIDPRKIEGYLAIFNKIMKSDAVTKYEIGGPKARHAHKSH